MSTVTSRVVRNRVLLLLALFFVACILLRL
jgi:hypothetical protein